MIKFTSKGGECEMHSFLRLPLLLCRWAGVFPIEGLHANDRACVLRYNTKSPYLVYHITTLVLQLLLFVGITHEFFNTKVSLWTVTSLLFYSNALLSMIFLIKLAKKWPRLVQRASAIEAHVASIRCTKHWDRYSRLATTVIMVLALVEHIFSVLFKIKLLMNCMDHYVIDLDFTKLYFEKSVEFLFLYTPYTHWKAFLYEVAQIQATFLWSIIDVITICISMYLVSYFRDLNKMIAERNEKNTSWEVLRQRYSHLIELVTATDHKLCLLILLSVFTNLCFICLQIFYLVNTKKVKKKLKFREIVYRYIRLNRVVDIIGGKNEYFKTQCRAFQESMKLPLLIGQWCGLIPVNGVTETDVTNVRFEILSYRFLYNCTLCAIQFTATLWCMYKVLDGAVTVRKLGNLAFYLTTCITSVIFMQVARKWHQLLEQVAAARLDQYIDSSIKFKCYCATITLFGAALLEHILVLVARVSVVTDCMETDRGVYPKVIEKMIHWIFTAEVTYQFPMGIVLLTVNFITTMNWSYSYIFIICISLFLTSVLEQINKKIKECEGQYFSPAYWRQLREDYNRATLLVRSFDDVIGSVIFFSFASNLFFVCLQLFNTLKPFGGAELVTYYLYSLVFIIGRFLAVALIASEVHTASLIAAPYLYSLPAASYCIENYGAYHRFGNYPGEKNRQNKIGVPEKPLKYPATFQQCMRATLVIGQIFSLMPVNGILSKNPKDMQFKWVSSKCFYSLASLLGQMFITIMCIIRVFSSKTSLDHTTPIIFYGTTCVSMMLFLRVAIQWPTLVRHIARTEELDPNYDMRLLYKCNITCAVVLALALMEHFLSLQSALAGAFLCRPEDKWYEGFVKHFYPWVFNVLPYSTLLGMMTQFFHFQSTFIWNFSDLFVICMSYYLTSRLENVNKALLNAQGKYFPESFWRTCRENYARAAQLVRDVDGVISGIIFISFANNLFFVCLQLLNTLKEGISGHVHCNGRAQGTSFLGGYEATAYFGFSLVYLMARAVSMSLILSQVNKASTVPAAVLYDVPSPVYCIEVQRFLDQVNGMKVALTGLQFFSVTRGLLLTVAGTIVTYELVMLQFSPPNQTDDTTVDPLLQNNTMIFETTVSA
ncbi:uncharacterized protein LOC121729495 [Aricia agestis]|uniref:uncharacterized protein LOC121729495 n=1 Tax=Aricia agestis TaxID=91739 RepID=UPI001C205981|nr:uncharacterized protein LOC121729495 [Aricia agestis]